MSKLPAIIIGAGHSGLAMSRALARRGIDHMVLERGQVANSWKTERWDSLRLLSPNWMNGLPGQPYAGPDPDGFMSVPELVRTFDSYALSNAVPIRTQTQVISVSPAQDGYSVQTDQGMFHSRSVVVASGACALPNLPAVATELPPQIARITPLTYRRPTDLVPGGVLVVGASASGLQLARELALAGRRVVLAAGTHLRLPRFYRGADILRWMERIGVFDTPWYQVDDIERVRRTPSLPLMGSDECETLDLNALQDLGVEIVGRLAAVSGGKAQFSGSLANLCVSADLKMDRLLTAIDNFIATSRLAAPPAEPIPPTRVPDAPRLSLDLVKEGIGTVLLATGCRPDHHWLDMPVFDRKGRIRHKGGVVGAGLYVMGLPYLRTRHSTHIAGASADAEALARHLSERILGREAA
ncbi:MAG: NAD(P)-binding domain-containing protein [Rhodobacteraceae bacterium]|nr:NAD(P)-binding domain-containing protein [Paracoccaceae bacterium]